MKQNGRMRLAAGLIFVFAATAPAADLTPVVQPFAVQPLSIESASALHRWKISLAPVFASQALDVASSYGMRELNPMLAGPDGRFGAQGAGIKLGSTAALIGLEYLIARNHPRAARIFSKINWSVSIVTTGIAAHNFAIR